MIKFGTGGWRAIIGDEFTRANVQKLTQAIAHMIKDEGKQDKPFCIGFDRRFLSKEAACWAAEVMAGEGIKCLVIDREAPTPLIMFTVEQENLAYGMGVTASHNPALYNGVKVFTKGGRDADEIVTAKIEDYIEKLENEPLVLIDYQQGIRENQIEEIDPFNGYIDTILAKANIEAIKKSRLKVALDPMYGVSQTSLRTLLMTTRCDLLVIHERHDTLFGGRLPAPNEKTLGALRNFVLENKCDLGVATDGDADRIGVIDDTGEFLHPNKILVLLYYYLMKYKGWRGPVVRNNSTTHMLDRVAESFEQTCYEVPVGFKHISAKMSETKAIIGGESSGGLTVEGHINGKDGIYAAMLLVEMIAVTGKRLSGLYEEIVEHYGQVSLVEEDFKLTQIVKDEMTARLFEERALPTFTIPVKEISYRDGCKVYFENGGWIIIRFSGTEPLIRICCEMSDDALAKQICETVKDFLGL